MSDGERSEPRLVIDQAGDAALEATAFALEAAAVERLRRLASAEGRVLERQGRGVFALGVAARISLPEGAASADAAPAAVELLAGISSDAPALALGTLPFDREVPAELVVPQVTVLTGGAGDEARALVIAPPAAARRRLEAWLRAEPPPRSELPDRFELVSSRSHAEFRQLVAEAVAAIQAGELEKVVLAREVLVRANRAFQQGDLVSRLRALHPSCLAFAVDGFLGASPELLCERRGTWVRSEPLAGTVARSGDPDADALLASSLLHSAKERREHALVVEAISAVLDRHCRDVEIPKTPEILELRNVAHLATPISAQLVSGASALQIAAELHPTPAIGGSPREAALAYLEKHEGLERGRYAGPVGVVDANGDGEFWIGIRSAQVAGSEARLTAGVGVVAGSDPDAELAETQLKLQALLAVAVRP